MINRRSFLLIGLLLAALAGPPAEAQVVIRPLWNETATIANGASVSGTIDLKGRPLVGIFMPSAWTTATITFQISRDGTTWYDLYNSFGDELVAQAAASRFIAFSPNELLAARYMRLRSGTSASAVNQGAARTLYLMTREVQ